MTGLQKTTFTQWDMWQATQPSHRASEQGSSGSRGGESGWVQLSSFAALLKTPAALHAFLPQPWPC